MAESKCHSLRQPDIRQFFGFRIGVHSLKSSMHARKYCCGGKARKERVDFFFSPSCGRKEVDLKGCTTTTSPSGNNRARTKSRPFIYGWSTGQQQQKGYGGSIPLWPPLWGTRERERNILENIFVCVYIYKFPEIRNRWFFERRPIKHQWLHRSVCFHIKRFDIGHSKGREEDLIKRLWIPWHDWHVSPSSFRSDFNNYVTNM